MTSVPMSNPVLASQQRPAPAHAAQGAALGGAAIDPIRLLNKYKYLLVIVAVVGAVVGTLSHVVLMKVYPLWSSAAVFNVLPATRDLADPGQLSQEEMSRFMMTEVRILVSGQVLTSVTNDPVLPVNAPTWAKQYMSTGPDGLPFFDKDEALKDLRDDVKSRVLPGTNLIELSYKWHDPSDTTAIVTQVREKYMALLATRGREGLDQKTAALRNTLKALDDESAGLSLRKETLISQGQVDTIDNRVEASRNELGLVKQQLIEVQRALDAMRTSLSQMQAEWDNPGGIVYSDELREEVDKHPQILELKTTIQRYETDLRSFPENGIGPEHRQNLYLQGHVAAARQKLEESRDTLLKEAFAAKLDQVRKSVASFEAQQKSLLDRDKTTMTRLQDLAGVQSKIKDIETRITGIGQSRTKIADDLATLNSMAMTASSNRVVELERERDAKERTFPQLKLMIPAGVALFLFVTAGVVLLMEIVDQRVKSPSDIMLIPRARLVGWVPDAAEDPAGQGAVETAFRDRPRGVVAESYRQVRAAISKRIQQADHRTILVVAGMPASGATSVASNMALSFAAADKKVLLIDANFRRPGLHRVFALPETPGLADVLGGQRELAQAVQATTTPNLDVLSAGSKDQRVFERLSTEVMGELLAKVRSMYDIVLIDVAPAIVGGDAVAIAHRCDATVLVVRAMADKRGMVARIKNDLGETRSEFLGAIVNGVKSAAGGYMKSNIKTAHEYQSA